MGNFLLVMLTACMILVGSCGVKHNVDGSVDVNVEIETEALIVRLQYHCDKKIDGVDVYNTRESYRQCVLDTLRSENEKEKDE